MVSSNPTERFSDRVGDYVRSRPTYPVEAIQAFGELAGLGDDSVVADVGAGTGISSALLIDQGWQVVAVEPNAAMREPMAERLGDRPGFRAVDGTAEQTTLEMDSVDAIFVAQAFHWFDPPAAAREFRRILRLPGSVGLIWNTRDIQATPFLRGYEQLLMRWGTDYSGVRHRNMTTEEIRDFVGADMQTRHFANRQDLELDSLISRLLSSSYTPPAGSPDREPMLDHLRELFSRTSDNGTVSIFYDCELHVGRWK